eukprot:CAMPEP_0202890462 /NCGR_PEP_ID=MMETSP1392-20130828/855_1 /ASSEMBLY_ACC=CAM_ASM_000868 /TAXON_ID=225041 /ORGANISM="Chlamydomonas chlamydogama, Strain SAG 11-48b" /LENGTH=54 /DNA_ID=CAMNT_0049574033 /DNA_START=63 /DNA_END=227 /DNA_ORIENTATION=+
MTPRWHQQTAAAAPLEHATGMRDRRALSGWWEAKEDRRPVEGMASAGGEGPIFF